MGGALLRGWIEAGSIEPSRSAVFDPFVSDDLAEAARRAGVAVNPEIGGAFDVLIVAVKPQIAAEALPAYGTLAASAVAVSVMAGASASLVSTSLGGTGKVVRAMPNLPASIGAGATALYAPEAVSKNECEIVETLMRAAGEVVWVKKETDIDLVTAVSGSGPAYFFLLAEVLEEAGVAVGLDKTAAALLARATLSGAGALIDADARAPAEMRQAVTSPGGTTAAALGILDGDEKAMRKLIARAVKAAAKRAGELSG
jgi:pyrroline-5-carboxylate reductase